MRIEKISIPQTQMAHLTAYLHDASPEMAARALRPAVLVFPGGGYVKVSDRENEPIAARFFALGFQVFVLSYSVGEQAAHMQPLLEAAQAMLLIRQNAALWHVVPNKVAVCGFSAGGHLAGCMGVLYNRQELLEKLGIEAGQCRPDALILCYPVISSGEFAHRGSFLAVTGSEKDDEIARQYSLEHFVSTQTPPVFIWHAVDDGSVPVENTLLFINQLQQHKVSFEAHLFEKGGHGISTCTPEVGVQNPRCGAWFTLCAEWLSEQFSFPLA